MAVWLQDLSGLYAEQGRPATLFLCLNGPSLGDIDLEQLGQAGAITMGVNNGGHLVRPDLWCGVDSPARFMESIWADPRILKFVPAGLGKGKLWDHAANGFSERRVRDCPGVVSYRAGSKFRRQAWLTEERVSYGDHEAGTFCVMLAALKVAWVLGFRRVYLLGCDFVMEPGRPYFFAENRSQKHADQNASLYRMVFRFFRALQPTFQRAGYEVYNCNPASGLKVFPYRALDRALDSVAIDLSQSTSGMYVPGRRIKDGEKNG